MAKRFSAALGSVSVAVMVAGVVQSLVAAPGAFAETTGHAISNWAQGWMADGEYTIDNQTNANLPTVVSPSVQVIPLTDENSTGEQQWKISWNQGPVQGTYRNTAYQEGSPSKTDGVRSRTFGWDGNPSVAPSWAGYADIVRMTVNMSKDLSVVSGTENLIVHKKGSSAPSSPSRSNGPVMAPELVLTIGKRSIPVEPVLSIWRSITEFMPRTSMANLIRSGIMPTV